MDWTRRYRGRFLAPDSSNRQSLRHAGQESEDTEGGAQEGGVPVKLLLVGLSTGSGTDTPESASLERLTLSSRCSVSEMTLSAVVVDALEVDEAEELVWPADFEEGPIYMRERKCELMGIVKELWGI